MIKKVDLQGFISKYYLKMNEQVVWSFKDNVLSVNFTTPSKDVIGNVRCEDIGFEDIDLPIFNTKKVQSFEHNKNWTSTPFQTAFLQKFIKLYA